NCGQRWERAKIRSVIHPELKRGPAGRNLGDRVEFSEIHLTDAGQVVVTNEHGVSAKVYQAIKAFARLRPVADRVADIPDSIEILAVGEYGFKGNQVGVDIGNNEDLHRGDASRRVA